MAEVTCRKCKATYTPTFMRDFYPDGADPAVGVCENCLMRQEFAPNDEPASISFERVKTLCLLGHGSKTCKFLMAGGREGGFTCHKGSQLGVKIQSLGSSVDAKGDNCSGPPDFIPTPAK